MIEIFLAWLYVETHPVVMPAESSAQIPREWIRDEIYIPPEFREFFAESSRRHEVPFTVLTRCAYSESWINPKAVRYHRDRRHQDLGIFQWNSKWLQDHRGKLGHFDPMEPREAIDAAAKWLKILYDGLGSWYNAVLAFKRGVDGRRHAEPEIKAVCRWIVSAGPWVKTN